MQKRHSQYYSHISTLFHLFLIWNLHNTYSTTQFLFFTIFLPSKHSFSFFIFLFFSFTSNVQNRCFFSIFSIHIFFYACSVFLFFFKSCGTYQFFFVLPNLFLPHPKWMLLTFYGKRTIIKIFRVVKKDFWDLALFQVEIQVFKLKGVNKYSLCSQVSCFWM